MGTKVFISDGYEEMIRGLGLDDPRTARTFQRGEQVLDSGSSRVLRFRWPDEDGDLFYFKIYRYYRLRPMFTFTYRPCRARTEFESLLYLERMGLPVAEPVAYGSHRVARVIRLCYIITRGVEDSLNLDQFLPAFFEQPRTDSWCRLKRDGLDDLAELVHRMHTSDFFDRNLVFRNILTRQPADGDGRLPFWFIDHPKGRVIPAERVRTRHEAHVFDLSSLARHAPSYFSRSERVRFFLRAIGSDELGEKERALLQDVNRFVARMLEKRQAHLDRKRTQEPRSNRPW